MFPLLSVAVHVTRLVPTGNCAGALLVTVTAPQLSLAVGLPRATPVAKHVPALALTVTSAGQVIVGTCVSWTVTVKVQVLRSEERRVGEECTVVRPTAKAKPLAGTLVRVVT